MNYELLNQNRSERYALQSVAKLALPQERVSKCLRYLNYNSGDVKVFRHRETSRSFYNGLIVCGSVWHCPVCAQKVSERRRNEIKKAFDLHKANEGKIAMLTLTFSHDKYDKLRDMLETFKKVTNKFMTGKAFHNIRLELGMIGRIRVMEVTYGINGWHPHLHIALLYKNEIDLKYMNDKMYDLYEKACNKFGFRIEYPFGLHLQSAEDAEKYFSKHGTWSIEQELSKSHIKKAKSLNGLSPFDLLRKYLLTEKQYYLNLFVEYAENFKWKRQIQWSQGLKQHFKIDEKTDEELAKESVERADLLGRLTFDDWKIILRYDLRAKFLELVEKYGFDYAYDLILKKRDTIYCVQ